jgi:hypothetical protein
MAETNIVAGLFGLTPEMYGEQQRRSALREGIDLAKLTPGQAGAAMTYAGARGLSGAFANALGVEDPQLKLISARNSIFQQIDQSNPESMMQGIKMLSQMGDNQGAMALADYYRNAQGQMAQTQQRLAAGTASLAQAARERIQGVDKDIQIANELSTIQDTLDQLKDQPSSPERDRAMNLLTTRFTELQRLTSKEKVDQKINYGPAAEIASLGEFGKPFSQLTKPEAKVIDTLLESRGLSRASAGAAQTNVNAYVPASVEAQKQFIQDVSKERAGLRNAPDALKNIEAAKKLIPTASTFMGKGGEPMLAAASFLNNRLGLGISTQGVTDATVLRTRLFEGILDNLKKLDSQPSQEQQRVLSEALGNLGTDPAALDQILDRMYETVTNRVDRYNTDVTESEARGIKFPFKPQITLPQRPRVAGSAASQIPTQSSVPTASQKPIYATNPTTKERIMSIDGGINWTSAR